MDSLSFLYRSSPSRPRTDPRSPRVPSTTKGYLIAPSSSRSRNSSYSTREYAGYGYSPVMAPTQKLRRDMQDLGSTPDFTKAISELISCLQEGHELYTNASIEFEQEVQGIRAYVKPDLIDLIWREKTNPPSSNRPRMRGALDPASNPSDTGREGQRKAQNLNLLGKTIVENFQIALMASAMRQRATASGSGLNLGRLTLVTKLKAASTVVSGYIAAVSKSPQHVVDLVKELEVILGTLEACRDAERHGSDKEYDDYDQCEMVDSPEYDE